ncbi:hypothetical protein, variant [Cryptococcus amylolentus CBS 6039]|uniref:DNA excision repair protein ERCC-5 n=1 Tax=Cryptococcus amylolentus CBS 6039 TaxID=1295533 RepID=A0A1E3I216_9TREE|nr:hypothetical protein, variant [Cryptococcus amylolentus CBS 6039]ODN82036.1 hypothetical protein, variant [Cryptococcus amylolentus CBS 6039]
MGVKGLWSLLNPVARPVQIESMEGKRLAIDSSIWLYQFQATMRDKDGRVLVNAHVLGFLRRINKLLFHGIKPVFVFDGGAPALKRSTIAERKRKKSGAAANHAKVAEKLFAAQMRREAVKAAQVAHQEKQDREAAEAAAEYARRYPNEAGEQIAEDVIYLDELEGRAGPSRPRSPKESELRAPTDAVPTDPEKRRKYFKKHDPYRLPETNMPKVSTADKPDARLATEEELNQFIDEVNPEDIDVESEEFRALPTEVQYEIIGDLRVRSRQQSHRRLANMLRAAPTALDFSMAQIKQLSQRNALTQQLLTVTDMVGTAHLTIPVRIAAERNREYVLVKKDETEGGGWALGIREGTKEKPIEVEPASSPKAESAEEESDIEPLSPVAQVPMDSDLRQHRRQQVLEALAARYAPQKPARASLDVAVKPFGAARTASSKPLFDVDEDVDEIVPTANDEALALALQQEELGDDETEVDSDLARALAMSRTQAERESNSQSEDAAITFNQSEDEEVDMEEVELVPSRTATPVAGSAAEPIAFEEQDTEEEDEFEEVDTTSATHSRSLSAVPLQGEMSDSRPNRDEPIIIDDDEDTEEPLFPEIVPSPSPPKEQETTTSSCQIVDQTPRTISTEPPRPKHLQRLSSASINPSPLRTVTRPESSPAPLPEAPEEEDAAPTAEVRGAPSPELPPRPILPPDSDDDVHYAPEPLRLPSAAPVTSQRYDPVEDESEHAEDFDDSRSNLSWSRSPTPPPKANGLRAVDSTTSLVSTETEAPRDDDADDGDLAPADVAAESDDYARFIASIKGRNLEEVRGELDDEIRVLNSENKVAMRDSDEITASMVAQIQTMLRHFGIPYITAPMEAEAQCAKLAQLGLVDGIITDDSDVFLFGGIQCYKNIFNDAKYAECFLVADLEREMMLTRERLITLAYFLGSDYTLGLAGIGPVMALELLANFPGPRGIYAFKDWWMKVQRGQDTEEETHSKWQKSFKKRFSKVLYLTADWPDPLVREAYLYPTVDESDEPFHWGFPRLPSLRIFLHEELSWSISKVDDELTPIVQRIALRGKEGGLKKQATLDPFFDLSAGTGHYAPKRRGTNVSKRLLGVIKQFKEAEAGASEGVLQDVVDDIIAEEQEAHEEEERGKGKGKRKAGDNEDEEGAVRGRKKAARGRKRAATVSSTGESVSSEGGSTSARSSSRGTSRGRGRGRGRGKEKTNK